MPDHDDIHDPGDEAYLRAEQALDDEAARAARRARILAVVAREPAATPALSSRRPVRRYGGWLAAACVAGLSVWTAQRVYRSTPPPRQAAPQTAPAAVAPPAPPASSAPASPALSARPPTPRVAARASVVAPPVIARAPIAPTPDIAPPPPLPIPPVEKRIPPPPAALAPPPAPIAGLSANAAPAATAKAGAAEPTPNSAVQSVVVTGARIERRDYAAPSPAISQPLADAPQVSDARSKALGARLRYDATAGRIGDIEPTLAQGVAIDAADENGETALMKSIQGGQSEAAGLLRRHGASLDLKNRAGVSARDMAAAKNDPELDRALGLTP